MTKDKCVNNLKDTDETVNNYFFNVGPQTDENIPMNLIIKTDKFLKIEINLTFLIAMF